MHLSKLKRSSSLENKGFTLTEVIVAAGVMAVGLLGVAGLTYVSMSLQGTNTDLIFATNIAESLVEELKNLSYTDSDLSHSNFVVTSIDTRDGLDTTEKNNLNLVTARVEEFLNRSGVVGASSNPLDKYTRYYIVCDSQNANILTHCPGYGLAIGDNIKYVEVTVFFKEKTGKNRIVSLSTLISRW